ncbi:MAG: nuclear transport factor 2 family protein [Paracoccaceae bacterium]|nr:nuclear transport factor 2 family protein [Paracoccaceae bacterium]MDE2914408.1 nuclear transport factor 2 family protein [Paracoccaceae bacterium]
MADNLDFQAEKALVLEANAAIDAAAPDATADVLARWTAPGFRWRGMHPFNELSGAAAVAESFWAPLKTALGSLQRRSDIFMAGRNALDGGASVWVVEMGHLMGLWDQEWLGVNPSRKTAFLRYVEFHRVAGGRIEETACYVDILNFLNHADIRVLPPATGASILTPGPRTHDGLLTEPQDANEGRATLELITAMIADLRGNGMASPEIHMKRFWRPDMCWFGPGGIGASAYFRGYRRGHTQPFEDGLEFIRRTEHVCRIGEGLYGGFFGYPSLIMRCTGGFMGLPATSVDAEMRVVDLYRRQGDKLAENWIFIDLLHFLAQQGLDVLSRLRGL